MIINYLLLILLIFLLLFFVFSNKKVEKFISCDGCIDVYGKCHPGTIPTRGCEGNDFSTCYVFYDESGKLHTPCGLMDKTSNQEKSCSTCRKCIYCKKKNKNQNKCLPKIIFQQGLKNFCDECPLNDQCLYNNKIIKL